MIESFFKAMTVVWHTLPFSNRTAQQMRAQQLAQMERELVMSATELDHARARHAMNQKIVKRLRAEVAADQTVPTHKSLIDEIRAFNSARSIRHER